MFYHEKLEKILELLNDQPCWSSKDLADRLGISRSTVQRCLDDLDRTGQAERIHGGVRRKPTSLVQPVPLDERNQTDAQAKRDICKEAMSFIGQSGYVYIDAGTTTLPIADHLNKTQHQQIHFVTNDVFIALALARLELNHTLLSGRLHPITQTISGPVSQAQITEFHFDVCFISADGIDGEYGVTCTLNDEAYLKRQAMKQSATKVLLGAEGKWNHRAGSLIAKLEDFNVHITNQASPQTVKLCKKLGLQIVTTEG
jgi:DeoR family fructose operon transcriptional repressor